MYDVIALGELLIDFAPNGKSEQENQMFEVCPGGAPCNMLAMLQKLNKKTAFIGKVGKDMFGRLLGDTLEKVGIDGTGLCVDADVHTTLTFVHTLPNGDRDFSFYRNPGADMMLCEADVRADLIRQAKIFHFGTLSMTSECAKAATEKALRIARENHLLISLDPNLRLPLWKSAEEAKARMLEAFSYCDILKISDNEIQFATGLEDYDAGIRVLQETYHIPLILLTLGKGGSRAYTNGLRVEVPAFLHDRVVDTTGAGDTFCACALAYILEHGMTFSEGELREMMMFCNAAASLITMRKGAMCSMPEKSDVEAFLASRKAQ